jgi:thiol-disulfide isomerase/thioredoxin
MNLAYFAATLLAVAAPGDSPRSGDAHSARPTPLDPSATVLLDFRADWCGPCRQMDSTIEQLLIAGYPVRRVNIDQERELANRFKVQGIPCFVMLVNGREVDRVVGVTDRARLEAMFSRNGVSPGMSATRGQSPDLSPRMRGQPFPQTEPATEAGVRLASAANPTGVNDGSIYGSRRGPAVGSAPFESLVRASVRLRIEDDHGNSVGSGTIIDARSGEALIITCGHVFRDAVKGGHIWVDLFGLGAPQGVLGKLIDYDLNAEIGLIRIETNYPVNAARMAPSGYVVHVNDAVISVGCDGGADATPRETHVTSINRYVGSPNLQVAFQPVQGRSGGGLFTSEGLVVGVCYAADPEAGEGLFAALPALHALLDREGLTFVYKEGAGVRSQESGISDRSIKPAIASAVERQGASPLDRNPAAFTETAIVPTSARSADPSERLTSDEQNAVDLIRAKAQNSEVICIFRPLNDPQAKSEIIVLDHASPALLRQLTGVPPARSSRQIMSMESPAGQAILPSQPVNEANIQRPTGSWPDVVRR